MSKKIFSKLVPAVKGFKSRVWRYQLVAQLEPCQTLHQQTRGHRDNVTTHEQFIYLVPFLGDGIGCSSAKHEAQIIEQQSTMFVQIKCNHEYNAKQALSSINKMKKL